MIRALISFAFLSFMQPSFSMDCGEVSIITFDAELYAPESEGTIEKRAFSKLYISKANFEKFFGSGAKFDDGARYDDRNVRALIRYQGKEYFVDRFGLFRQEKSFGFLNTQAFEHSLTESCK